MNDDLTRQLLERVRELERRLGIQETIEFGATHTHAAYVAVDGSTPLTADWDIGDTRKLIADIIRARDAAGLALQDDGGNLGVFVEDGGNVGIGGSPSQKLTVATGHISLSDGFGILWGAGNAYILGSDAGDYIQFQGVNVGIGTAPSYPLHVVGNAYFSADVSALSFTDRTKGFEGDALAELAGVKAKDGKLDHSTLPAFARTEQVRRTVGVVDGVEVVTETVEEGRDLGAMISMLTVAVQQLAAKVAALEK